MLSWAARIIVECSRRTYNLRGGYCHCVGEILRNKDRVMEMVWERGCYGKVETLGDAEMA
jgi:hypothetical protein